MFNSVNLKLFQNMS